LDFSTATRPPKLRRDSPLPSRTPALHRLEKARLLRAEWGEAETGREAKFYSLTRLGRKQLEAETANWDRLSEAVTLILRTAE